MDEAAAKKVSQNWPRFVDPLWRGSTTITLLWPTTAGPSNAQFTEILTYVRRPAVWPNLFGGTFCQQSEDLPQHKCSYKNSACGADGCTWEATVGNTHDGVYEPTAQTKYLLTLDNGFLFLFVDIATVRLQIIDLGAEQNLIVICRIVFVIFFNIWV